MIVSQDIFHKALRQPDQPIPDGLNGTNNAPAGRRFNVYRNNVATSLMDALASGFPVISKLLGQENFRNLARDYQWDNPPSSPLMMLYGESFPDFLDHHPALSKLPYLGDVARLEYAIRRSYHAADAPQLEATSLEDERILQARFTLSDTVELVSSPYPIFGVWRINTQPDAPKPTAKAEFVAIFRPDYDPLPEEVSGADFALLTALKAGETLQDALAKAQSTDPDHDFARILGRLLAGNAIACIDF